MNYIWLFFVASFAGWVLETLTAAFKQKRFMNRGVVNTPLCILYGSALVFITVFSKDLDGFCLFIGATLIATVFEWSAGHLIEKLYHERWWDYSNRKWNLDGYICISASLIWGILSFLMVKWGNKIVLKGFYLFPHIIRKIIILALICILLLDILATWIVILRKNQNVDKWKKLDRWYDKFTYKLSNGIYERVNRRIEAAYPKKITILKEKADPNIFASGLSFYKVFLLFFIGSFLGDITETIYCRVYGGVWMSRSSLVWGPFSIVWGLGIALATILLYRYKNHSEVFLFSVGTILGGAYEYVCSVFTEIAFGKVFWEYSHMPFNLGGRINLLYCFFWGIAAVVWMKHLYPKFSAWIEKIPKKSGKILTNILVVFMCINMIVSSMALIRSTQREQAIPATSGWQKIMDEHFHDERLAKIYPNMIQVD